MRRLAAGAFLIGAGLLLHLIEPVSRLDCGRGAPGPAQCVIARSWFGVLPYAREEVQAAALVAEPRRASRVRPEAVTCTALALMDGAGDATEFACLRDEAALSRARAFFADGSADRTLDVRYSETLVVVVAGAFVAAGMLVLGAAALRRPRRDMVRQEGLP
jgi:hypothetical protein